MTDPVTIKSTADIRSILQNLQDSAYRDFQAPLIPNIPTDRFIGVRTPALRALAKEVSKSPAAEEFLASLPHSCFEENQLHAFLIAETKDYDLCIRRLEAFLPYVDNWATCDQMTPKILRKNLPDLEERVRGWLASSHT